MDDETETVDGLTREEWTAQLLADGWTEREAAQIVARAFGDSGGDVIDETDPE